MRETSKAIKEAIKEELKLMFKVKLKVFNRHYANDNSYYIEEIMCTDQQIGKWLANKKTFHYEVLDYWHIN